MPSPLLQSWWYVKLVMLDVSDATSTTYYLSNRPIIDDTNYCQYIPILQSVQGLGNRMDTFLPQQITGSVTLRNTPNSFGYERCFGDLLQRQTPVNQSIEIYMAKTALDDMNVTADFALQWKSTVASVSFGGGADDPTVTLSLASEVIPRRVVTKVIDSVSFPSAPAASIGKNLPIVFGAGVEVRPVVIEPDYQFAAGPAGKLAYATTLSTTFPVEGVTTYYVREKTSQEYGACLSASDVTTPTAVISQTTNDLGIHPNAFAAPYREIASPLSGTLNYLVTGGRMRFECRNNGAWTAASESKLLFKLYRNAPNGVPEVLVAQGEALKQSYQTSFRGASNFWVAFSFGEPIFLGHANGYSISFSQTTNSTAGVGGGDWVRLSADSLVSAQYYYKAYEASNTSGDIWLRAASATSNKIAFDLYACKFNDTKSTAADGDGLGYSYVEVASPLGYVSASAINVDFIFSVNGLTDNGSGSVTGTPSANLQAPLHALTLLGYSWNGSAWVATLLDGTKYSASQGGLWSSASGTLRVLKGATSGRVFLDALLADLCRASASRLALFNNSSGKLGLWAWGVESTPSFTIDSESSRILRVEHQGVGSIINRLTLYYNQTLRNLNVVTGSAEGQFRDFAGTLDWYNGLNYLATALTSKSEALYGKRLLNDAAYPWLGDSASAESVARAILSTYALPQKYILVDVPYDLYSTIDMLDVGYIVSPNLPAFHGTSMSAKLPTYNKTEVDIAQGAYWKRAALYRVQVEGREINWNINEYPTLTLTCRWLDNYPTDPT